MGKFRIYPSKSNTIIEGTEINTGKNGVMELWYGNEGITRHLVHFDFDTYNSMYTSGYVPHITATTGTLNMKSCYPIFEQGDYSSAKPATGVDVEVKVVQQYWASGIGHDLYGVNTIDGPSNWYSASTTSPWALEGGDFAYTVFSGHVEDGSADLSLPINEELELWNVFTGDNHGFVIKFSDEIEALTGSTKSILKYYTQNALTSHLQPYIELEWVDTVGPTGTTTISGTADYFVTMPTLESTYDQSAIIELPVRIYPVFTSNMLRIDNLEWKLTLKDGTVNSVMIDWETVPWNENENYINLNTNWLHANNEYIIDFRYVYSGVVINSIEGVFKFRVIEDN